MKCSSKTENGLSLLGGALLGAAVMYLLDPESGRRRRQNLGETAGDAWDKARDLGADVADRARGAASGLASGASGLASDFASGASDRYEDLRDSHAAHGLSSFGNRIGGYAHDLWDRALHLGRRAGSRAGGAAYGAAESARGASHSVRHRLARAIDSDVDDSHVLGYTATGLGTLLAGAAAMYLLDPQRGRGRRAYVLDQCRSIYRQTGDAFRRTGTQLRNKMQGVAHTAGGQVSRLTGRGADDPSGERLLQRIRSQMGHVISRPTDVQLMTDAGGVVTLYGRVPSSEMDALLACVNGVPGVSRVINRIEIQDYSGSGFTGTTQPAQM